MYISFALFVVYIVNNQVNCETDETNLLSNTLSEAEIVADLINSTYDKRVRPTVKNKDGSNAPVEIVVDSYLRSMSNIDFVRMEYSLQLTFRQSWKDSRLAFGERADHVPDYIVITRNDLIWTPDTFFVNEKKAHRHVIDRPNFMFRIHKDGRVLYSERISLVLSCPMYLQKYPMDSQVCNLNMASYAYTTDDIVYKWKESGPIQFHPLLNGSLPCFTLDAVEPGTCTSVTSTGEYSCIKAVFYLHRQFSYYLVQVYIPSTLLVIVSWVSFWLDRSAVPARVTLGVTTLLTMTTQSASINNALPPVSYIKAIDIWIGTCLFFIFSTVLEYAWVSYKAASMESKAKRLALQREFQPMTAEHERHRDHEKLLKQTSDPTVESIRKTPVIKFWHNWTYDADASKMIDLRARILFPAVFVVFQLIYWAWYISL